MSDHEETGVQALDPTDPAVLDDLRARLSRLEKSVDPDNPDSLPRRMDYQEACLESLGATDMADRIYERMVARWADKPSTAQGGDMRTQLRGIRELALLAADVWNGGERPSPAAPEDELAAAVRSFRDRLDWCVENGVLTPADAARYEAAVAEIEDAAGG